MLATVTRIYQKVCTIFRLTRSGSRSDRPRLLSSPYHEVQFYSCNQLLYGILDTLYGLLLHVIVSMFVVGYKTGYNDTIMIQ